jgi:SAM-dependent methyltransferase
MTTPIPVPEYAGGSHGITHVDEGLLRFFDTKGCRSMLDVGCGPGAQVTLAKHLGWRAIGLDVDPHLYLRPGVALSDLCVEPILLPQFDLVWSVEAAEHIPDRCVPNYIQTLTDNARIAICMTASQTPMAGHVSVHPVEWWVERIVNRGRFVLDKGSASIIRNHSTMGREFMRETGMIFWRVAP